MAVAKKKGVTLFKLVSTAGTGFFYLCHRNVKNKQEKLSFTKYDPKARKHVLFQEKKLSK